MNIIAFADIADLTIEIYRHPNQANRWTATFKCTEVKLVSSSSILTSKYGEGTNPADAINDYVEEIKGKILIVFAGTPDMRRTYNVPDNLDGI